MRGYSGIELTLLACVHFVRNDEIDGSIHEIVADLRKNEIACAYLDYLDRRAGSNIADEIASILKLDHAPYGPGGGRVKWPWVPFLDDLGSLSFRVNGLVIVIDNANVFFSDARNEAFDLIEAFLIQFHHWLEMKKPCHLCFQLEPNELIKAVFSDLGSGTSSI